MSQESSTWMPALPAQKNGDWAVFASAALAFVEVASLIHLRLRWTQLIEPFADQGWVSIAYRFVSSLRPKGHLESIPVKVG